MTGQQPYVVAGVLDGVMVEYFCATFGQAWDRGVQLKARRYSEVYRFPIPEGYYQLKVSQSS